MRKSSSPDITEDIASQLEKWEHLAAHPTNFVEKPAPVTWPSMPAPEPETGEYFTLNLFSFLYVYPKLSLNMQKWTAA
jgi:hypothetical protein